MFFLGQNRIPCSVHLNHAYSGSCSCCCALPSPKRSCHHTSSPFFWHTHHQHVAVLIRDPQCHFEVSITLSACPSVIPSTYTTIIMSRVSPTCSTRTSFFSYKSSSSGFGSLNCTSVSHQPWNPKANSKFVETCFVFALNFPTTSPNTCDLCNLKRASSIAVETDIAPALHV